MEKSRPKIDAGDTEFFSDGFRLCGVEGGVFGGTLWWASVFAVFVAPAPGTDWRRGEKEQFDVRVMLF
jgi:hypothetical protein